MLDAWVMGLNAGGDVLWSLSLGPWITPRSIAELPSGGLLAAGDIQTRNEPYQAYRAYVAAVSIAARRSG